MGIVNCTPDSFSDGGKYSKLEHAKAHAKALISEGVDILDIGGESSRPGAKPVSLQEEEDRVLPLIEYLRQISSVAISIDTTKPALMRSAVQAGAGMINDISALASEDSLQAASELEVPICLMHMQGEPASMQANPSYNDLISDINQFFLQKIERCLQANIKRELLILDPGFGFGKTTEQNLQLMKQLPLFGSHGLPVLLGVSRKNTLGEILNKPVDQRLIGGLTLNALAVLSGVSIIRTHDVEATKQVVTMLKAVEEVDY